MRNTFDELIERMEEDFPSETLYDDDNTPFEVIIVTNSKGDFVDMGYYIKKLKEIYYGAKL